MVVELPYLKLPLLQLASAAHAPWSPQQKIWRSPQICWCLSWRSIRLKRLCERNTFLLSTYSLRSLHTYKKNRYERIVIAFTSKYMFRHTSHFKFYKLTYAFIYKFYHSSGTFLNLVPSPRMVELYLNFPMRFHSVVLNQMTGTS
jgi:hypothetical protein